MPIAQAITKYAINPATNIGMKWRAAARYESQDFDRMSQHEVRGHKDRGAADEKITSRRQCDSQER